MNTSENNTSSQSNIVSSYHGDFARAPQGAAMAARPGDAPVSTHIAVNEYGDYVRVQPGSAMNERPGYAPVNTNISSNSQGDFNRVPPRPNSSNSTAMTPNGLAHQQQSATGGPHRQQVPTQQDGPKRFQIYVNSFIDSRNHAFEVSPNETVDQLKGQIEAKLGVAESQQRLVYAGKNLMDGMRLCQYDLRPETTVHMTGRLRGG